MPDQSEQNIQRMTIEGATYEVHAVFGDKLRLEDILAQRVRKDLEAKNPGNQADSACLTADSEL